MEIVELTFSEEMSVGELLAGFPDLICLLLELDVGCPGCPMARFCSLAEVCRQYEMYFDQFVRLIKNRMEKYESN
jgi:hybrid cluster-associated redox disulfide protein